MNAAGRAMLLGMDPWWFLNLSDSGDSLFAQAALMSAESRLEEILDSLAVKIRNQIGELFKGT